MKVKDLILLLQQSDPERIIVMSCDSEGNRYSPLAEVSTCAYEAESTWSGEIGLEKLTDTHRAAGYSEEDVKEDGVPAIVVYPTN